MPYLPMTLAIHSTLFPDHVYIRMFHPHLFIFMDIIEEIPLYYSSSIHAYLVPPTFSKDMFQDPVVCLKYETKCIP
jgi:hypothetical protein